MGKAAKQAKNKAHKQKVKTFLSSVKGSLDEELKGDLGQQIFDVLKENDGRV